MAQLNNNVNDVDIFYNFYLKATNLAIPLGVNAHGVSVEFFHKALKYIFTQILNSSIIADDIIKDSSFANFSDNQIDDLDEDVKNYNNPSTCKSRIKKLLTKDDSAVKNSLYGIINDKELIIMDKFNNERLNNYQDIVNDIHNYVNTQYKEYHHKKQIKSLKHNRNLGIALAILIPCLIMTIAAPIFQYINGGLAFTAVAFYMHFFNIDMIDRVILMLICDCPIFVHIHRVDKKIDKLLDK